MSKKRQIDDKNEKILTILQDNARTPNAEIARQLGLTTSAVHERIRRMEERGIIESYTVKVNPEAAEVPLLAMVFVKVSPTRAVTKVGNAMSRIKGVEEVYHLAGEECFLAKLRCRDTESLETVLLAINDIEEVVATRTVIVLRPFKECSGAQVRSRKA